LTYFFFFYDVPSSHVFILFFIPAVHPCFIQNSILIPLELTLHTIIFHNIFPLQFQGVLLL
jgi:hypothetical protein